MRKNYKQILVYAIVLLMGVLSIIITGCTSPQKTDEERAYQNLLEESQATIKNLEKENAELKKENKELQTKLTQAMSEKSEITTQGQAMTDLLSIYELYKEDNKKEAREEFKKIEPMGFDDTTLRYYELLKEVLER